MPDIADLIAQYIGPQDDLGIKDVTITRATQGARTVGNLAGGTNPTTSTFGGRGSIERTGKFMDGTLVKDGHALITILGGTISPPTTPAEGDRITIDGATYKVSKVHSDQVGAIHECEAQ